MNPVIAQYYAKEQIRRNHLEVERLQQLNQIKSKRIPLANQLVGILNILIAVIIGYSPRN